MFLKKDNLLKELPIIIGILIYAYFINSYSGNIGVIPIDSFGFFDTGQSVLKGKLPIRDFWIFTGLLVDYMEAVFLFIFGNNWNSHLAHGSFMNIIGTAGLYFFLREINLKKNQNTISTTIVGSFLKSKKIESISDIDIVIIVKDLNEDTFNEIINSYQNIKSTSIGLEGYEVFVNSTFGPLKFNSNKK